MVKEDFQCHVCEEKKSCFFFSEYALPFSICMECYVIIKDIVDSNAVHIHRDEACALCDSRKDTSFCFDTQQPIGKCLMMCTDCFAKLVEFIENRIRYL